MSVEVDALPHEILSKRHEVLELLLEHPRTKPDLVETLPCSRSTIDRAIEELQEIGCIEPTAPNSSQYHATTHGDLLLQTHQEYLDRLQQLQEVRPILTELPANAPISEAIINGADVYRSVRSPDIAFRPGQELKQDATKMIGTAPGHLRGILRRNHQPTEEGRIRVRSDHRSLPIRLNPPALQ